MNSVKAVAVLFTCKNSVYQNFPECDCYDIHRDAKTFAGGLPVVAHPPCRAWGKLAHFAKPRPGERNLALWAVDQVRINGGILEHPLGSRLWAEKPLPKPGFFDEFGGFTIKIPQFWFGHKAFKDTLLYICGIHPDELPEIPFKLGEAEFVVSTSKRKVGPWKKELSKEQREQTPIDFAKWLIETAKRAAFKKGIAA